MRSYGLSTSISKGMGALSKLTVKINQSIKCGLRSICNASMRVHLCGWHYSHCGFKQWINFALKRPHLFFQKAMNGFKVNSTLQLLHRTVFLFSFLFFLFNYFIVVQLQLSAFTSPPQPNPPPSLASAPPWFCPCVLHSCSWKLFSPLSLPTCPLVTVMVLNSNVSGYILLVALFCWLRSTYRWDHMAFVPHCLAYFT